ncbi:OmpA family protein [Vitreimonas sp.]|uniref:OmpA family protein n=1 Tax=Vitreimonas sp. TaxID=3069702 RepID=UPI002ED7C8C4
MTSFDPDKPNKDRPLLWVGLAGAALAALLGMLSPHAGAVWRMPAVLEERVETALLAAGFPGLSVRMEGQQAVLSGIVEDEADIASAARAALTAAGHGGAWSGGVTSVDTSDVTLGAFERPYAWNVRRDGSRVVLSGAVPSENARADLLTAAAQAFPTAEAIDEMHVAGGAPSPAFTAVARDAIRLLADLNTGEARIVDNQLVVIGDGGQAAVEALRAAFDEPPAPFRSRLAVTIDGLDVDHPELQGLNLSNGDAETCERAFDRLMERNVINFAPGSSAIDPSSRQVLDSLASVALRCDRFSIEVAGHTDNTGARDLNMSLSQTRADAVANYLSGQGVARSRLTARGYGPDRPRASNATPAGQASNRRIEFYVSG